MTSLGVDWQGVKAALVAFVESTGAVPAGHVFWSREGAAVVYDDVVELELGHEAARGYDDVELVAQPDGRAVARITGWREFVVSIRVSSRNQRVGARTALERIRAGFHHPRAEALTDQGVAFLRTEELMSFDAVLAGRWESTAVLDVHFGALSTLYEPDTDGGIDLLDEVGLTSLLE